MGNMYIVFERNWMKMRSCERCINCMFFFIFIFPLIWEWIYFLQLLLGTPLKKIKKNETTGDFGLIYTRYISTIREGFNFNVLIILS